MQKQPVLVSWSGGKDSALALERLRSDPAVEIVGLLTSVSTEFDRISMHGVRRALLHLQAARLGLPLFEIPLGPGPSNTAYEEAFAGALREVRALRPETRTVAFGDLFLEDIRAYRDALLARLEWSGHYPLWQTDTAALARHFVERRYRAVLTCVDTTQLAGSFAGREFDATLLGELPKTVDPCGERGEFHTFVFAGPLFPEPIPIRLGERVLRDGRFVYCDVMADSP